MYSSQRHPVIKMRNALLAIAMLTGSSMLLALEGEAKPLRAVECPASPSAEARPPQGESRSIVYRSIDGHDLRLHLFDPPGHRSSHGAAALVLFYGGGWSRGSVRQFESHARFFARRGMFVALADYRVFCRQGTGVPEAIVDARAAVRWVREHSSELGIDPNRIVAGGGSAGGYLALGTATLDDSGQAPAADRVGSMPDALLLFSTPVDLTPADIRAVSGLDPEQSARLSPIKHLRRGLPPTLFLQGTEDHLVNFSVVESYCAEARALGNQCTVKGFAGGHTFFNRRDRGAPNCPEGTKPCKATNFYQEALEDADKFLGVLGYVSKP